MLVFCTHFANNLSFRTISFKILIFFLKIKKSSAKICNIFEKVEENDYTNLKLKFMNANNDQIFNLTTLIGCTADCNKDPLF